MVHFKLSNKLALSKILRRYSNGHSSEIPLQINNPEATKKESLQSKAFKYVFKGLALIAIIFFGLFLFHQYDTSDDLTIEKIYLQNFYRDLDEDIKNLKNSIDINSSRILDVKQILSDLYKTPDSVELKNFSNRYISAIYVSKFAPSSPTFEDFTSLNDQEVLTNFQLRNDIFRYYNNVANAIKTIENYETFHKETFVPKFNSEYIKGRSMVIFKKYYENIQEDSNPDLSLWNVSKNSKEFVEAENLLLQRLLFLDRSLEIESDLLNKAKELQQSIHAELEKST